MDSLRIHCPDCATEYVFAPENRGVSVQCPVCQGVFQVPREGDLAVVVTHGRRPQPATTAVAAPTAPAMFQLTCPKCGTAYSIPEAYRGNQGECGICNTIFLIPATGTVGQWVSGGPATPAAAAPAAAGQPVAPKRPYSGTSTMALSRASIIHNTMTPKEKDAKAAAPSSGPLAAPRGGTATGSLPRSGTATGSLPRASVPRPSSGALPAVPPAATPAPPPAPPKPAGPHKAATPSPAPAGHRVVLPAWLARIPLNPGEQVRDWKPAPQDSAAASLAATLLPVLCTLLAAGLAGSLGAVLSAVLFTLLGGAAWGFFAFVCLPALRRPRAIMVTDQRVLLVAGETVVAVAQPHQPET